MKIFVLLLLMLTLTACKQENSNGASATPPEDNQGQQSAASILSLWQNPTGKKLDFRALTLNQELPSDLMLACNGNFGNQGKVNGMDKGDVKLSGTTVAGYLFVGHLKYAGAEDKTCADMSKEIYSYSITESILTFCALNWNACGTYVIAP